MLDDKAFKVVLLIVAIMAVLFIGAITYLYGVILPEREQLCLDRGGYQFEVTSDSATCWRADGTKIFL